MFSRREWLMLLSIFLMIEAWILNIGYSFKNDQDVINYISFASTIASLLLAVIAIIYGFYQSDGQRKSAAAIDFQLGSMRTVQQNIDAAASGLVSQLSQINAITSSLSVISESIESTHAKLGSLEGGLSSIKQTQEALQAAMSGGKNAPAPVRFSAEQVKTAAALILRSTSFQLDVVGYALFRAFDAAGSRVMPLWEFLNRFVEQPLGESRKSLLSQEQWAAVAIQVGSMPFPVERDSPI